MCLGLFFESSSTLEKILIHGQTLVQPTLDLAMELLGLFFRGHNGGPGPLLGLRVDL